MKMATTSRMRCISHQRRCPPCRVDTEVVIALAILLFDHG
jgi:hypothetical protein